MRSFDESVRSHFPLGTREHAEKRARSSVTCATWRTAFRLWVRVCSFHDGLLLDGQRHSGDSRDFGAAFCRRPGVRLRRGSVKYYRRREASFSRAEKESRSREKSPSQKSSVARLTRALTLLTSGGDKPMWTVAAKTQISPWSVCSWCVTVHALLHVGVHPPSVLASSGLCRVTMADLDDFFAKKDRKKAKGKKFATTDDVAKKLEETGKRIEKPKPKEKPVNPEGEESQHTEVRRRRSDDPFHAFSWCAFRDTWSSCTTLPCLFPETS